MCSFLCGIDDDKPFVKYCVMLRQMKVLECFCRFNVKTVVFKNTIIYFSVYIGYIGMTFINTVSQ